MWRILELTVPGFDPTVPIRVPTWTDIDDIFHFAQAYLLFFWLQAKVKFHYDDRTRSGMFLRAVQSTEFADTVTTLLSHVNSYRHDFDDGYLPPHLRLHGLATSIHQTTQARLRDVILPCVRHVLDNSHTLGDQELGENTSRVQGVPRVHRLNWDDHTCRAVRQNSPYHPRECIGHDYRGRGLNDESPDRHHQPQTQEGITARGRGRAPRGPGRLARPDRNRRPFLPDVQCAACKRVGHVAKHCDMLATAICLERYMKTDLSPALRDSIEQEWLARWKERLGNPTQTPRQVLRAYVEELDITVAGLDDKMEWETWDDNDIDNPAVE